MIKQIASRLRDFRGPRLTEDHLRLTEALERVHAIEQELAQARSNLKLASAAQGALHRRSEALKKDWPDLWKRYFTRQGEADRALQAHKKVAR
jgi:hypothetical protein